MSSSVAKKALETEKGVDDPAGRPACAKSTFAWRNNNNNNNSNSEEQRENEKNRRAEKKLEGIQIGQLAFFVRAHFQSKANRQSSDIGLSSQSK